MIFVDTSFWLALQLRRDAHHAEASRLIRAVSGPLVTSNHVRGETWTFLRHRAHHDAAVRFLERLDASARVRTVFVAERIEAEALTWVRRHDERPYSFVDATSFALMRSLAIREALAFDVDFTAAGFIELRA